MEDVMKKLPQFTTRIRKRGGAIALEIYVPINYLKKVMENKGEE
jgi:hypothetical protein